VPLVLAPPTGPLRQGDILEGVTLFVSGDEGPVVLAACPCVVLSRDCKALRDTDLLVAAIRQRHRAEFEAYLNNEKSTLDEARRTFAAIRDGDAMPDGVYLGSVPSLDGRWMIDLSSVHTVRVPEDQAKRDEWIARHRRAVLHFEAVRHLQTRLFAAISRQGFDDHEWWDDPDLEALVAIGKRRLSQEIAALDTLNAKGIALANAAKPPHAGHLRNHDNQTAEQKAVVESLKQELKPYEAALAARKRASGEPF